MRPLALLAAAGLTLAAATPAAASVMVVGNDIAVDCSKAAFAGRFDRQSIQTCTRALQEDRLDRRDRAGTLVNRGVMLTRAKDYGAARADLDKAADLEPTLGEAFVNRGVVMMADRDYAQALTEIERGLSLGVDEPAKAYYNRALVHESLDDAKSAWLDYRRAQELAPEWEAPRRQLTRFTVSKP
jgi:tetratricopeptide (TPR) repeat protein